MSERLTASDLCLLRGDRCLFRGLSFGVRSGELLLVEGPNGSGKTSLLRGVAGLLGFEEGAVHWDGQPVDADMQTFRAQLAWLSHRGGLKLDLTLLDNLRFEMSLRPSRDGALPAVIERLDLGRLTELPLKYLSAGQQRRVALARMLLFAGPMWIMDEPFTNLDVRGQALVTALLDEHLGAGGLAMAATHQPVAVDAPVVRLELT